ncbi:MAG: MaoC family dehydratase [Hyphomicrobiaceae bacterium]|nr:MaoC family dehydratase [Hyphomicrobiaceae bacterium]
MQRQSSSKSLFWEEVVVGETVAFGRRPVSKEEIIEFASAFDPQPFHLDEEAARSSLIGRLCASGWHSCAIFMRMIVDGVLSSAAGLGSPGLDEVKWLKPVFPGDELTGRYTCTAKRVLRSRPEVGLCQILFEMLNQNGDVVMTWNAAQLIGLRTPESGR